MWNQPLRAAFVCSIFLGALLTAGSLHAATIRGRTETESGRPVARVRVSIATVLRGGGTAKLTTTITDETGHFQFDGVKPATYAVSTEKQGWVDNRHYLTISDDQAEDEVPISITLQLTLLRQMLGGLQFGSVIYVWLFGLLIVAFNYFMAPEPVKGVTVAGWTIMLASVVIGAIKLEVSQALVLLVLGVLAAGLVQRFGKRTASRRLQLEAEEDRVQTAQWEREEQEVLSLVGKGGVTLTDLKTCGTANINGIVVQVRAMQGFIPQQTDVVVTAVDGTIPVVQRAGQR